MLKVIKKADIALLHFINTKLKCKILDKVMAIITFFGSATFCAIFVLLTIISKNRDIKNLGILSSFSIIVSSGITHLIKRVKNRIRPYVNIPDIKVNKIGVDDYSFPSGHTTAAFSIGMSIAFKYTGLATFSLIFAALVGFSRIYLGVHYPTDVAAGAIVGTSSSLLIKFIV